MDPLTVEVREEDIPVAAVQVPPTFVVDEVPLGENPMEVAPVPASDHWAPNLEKVEFSVSEYLPIGSPAVTHDAQESGEIQDNREMMRAMNNFVEAVSLEQICTASDATRRGIPESSTRAQEPSLGSGPSSGPQTGAEQEVLGPKSFSDRTAAGTDDTGRGLPMNVAIGVPFDVESMRETTIGGRKDGSRTEVRKNFLFFVVLEKHGLRVDWTTVDKSRNIREIPVAERYAARVELWKHITVFRGSLLYPEEPILRTDERVPKKPRAKKTSPAGSTPAEDETSPATKKTAKRKLNLDPPRSRSPSPEALERNQPPRNGKKKVEEGAAADMDRKGKRKVDDQPSTVPAKKNKRGDDSDEDSNKSNHAKLKEKLSNTHTLQH
ncbi:hypothetical protein R1sor_003397 [Riccia sorocarpa]|uniref:Uncharacterized protein n=1 Tax=Riccia sorocarpa TaxID=122646 RepID=A0ABD3H4V7_9MARC